MAKNNLRKKNHILSWQCFINLIKEYKISEKFGFLFQFYDNNGARMIEVILNVISMIGALNSSFMRRARENKCR